MAEPRALYLEADGLGRLELDERRGYIVTQLDLGWPTVRAVSNNRVNAPGADDTTALYGARAVSFEVACFAPDDGSSSRRDVMARLRAYVSPGRRSVLVFCEDDGQRQRVRLRGDGVGWAMSGASPGVSVRVQLSWSAPDGILEDAEATTANIAAYSAQVAQFVRTYPKTYPLRYDEPASTGALAVINGTEPAAPVLRLWGPCTNPRLLSVDTGAELVFGNEVRGDLILTADQYAEVNVREATVYLNGRKAEPLFDRLNLLRSSFLWLAPGVNRLRYLPEQFDLGARAQVIYRRAFL